MITRHIAAALASVAAPVAVAPMSTTHPPGPFYVFFDWKSAELDSDARTSLDNAAAAFQQVRGSKVLLAGFSDRSGTSAGNRAVARDRVEAVRTYLRYRAVPDASVVTSAFGENRPLIDTADGVREAQNRRVEIHFIAGQQ